MNLDEIKKENNCNEMELLQFLQDRGMLTSSDVLNIPNMKKQKAVDEVHPFRIWQGKGQDSRYFTYIPDPESKAGRKKIAKSNEKAIYEYMYEVYFGEKESYKNITLKEVYLEWLNYKNDLANRSNYIRRIDNDYQKYYINEPLSNTILKTPLRRLTKIDIETWAYAIIKKYCLTKKAYYNMSIILRQVFQYLIDKEILFDNPYTRIKIPSNTFRRVSKPKAETQIFYQDELVEIIETSKKLANEKQDENYLTIPLMFYSGIRISECLGLSFEDFVRESNKILVHSSLVAVERLNDDGTWDKRKYEIIDNLKQNAEPREVLATDALFEIVDIIKRMKLKNEKSINGYLFSVMTPAEIEYKLYSICEKLGYTKRSTHKIRKTYISKLINSNVDLDFVREQVGHKEAETTLSCYNFSTTREKEQIVQLNKLLA